MRRILVVATLFLGALASQAQEKVMNVRKTDGTTLQTRVADLKQISFLNLDETGKGLTLKTFSGETAAIRFEANPTVTVSGSNTTSKLVIKSGTPTETMTFEIANIAEIQFAEGETIDAISEVKGFSFVMQDGCAVLRDLPEGVQPGVYTLEGLALPAPPVHDGELRLSRATIGTGTFIVKVGSFSAKIQF